MKHSAPHILSLLGLPVVILFALLFVGCTDEQEDSFPDDTPLEIGVSARWQCGRTLGKTRALDDPIGNNPEEFPIGCYPEWLHITVGPHDTWETAYSGDSDIHPERFVIQKTVSENDNYETEKFIAYHKQYKPSEYKDGGVPQTKPFYTKSKARKLIWEARTLSPNYNALGCIPQAWGETDYTSFNSLDLLSSGGMAMDDDDPKYGGKYIINGKHLFFTLGHAYALFRIYFAVGRDYDKIRFVDLKNVTINGANIMHEEHYILPVANTGSTSGHGLYAYAYVKPSNQWNGDPFADASSLADGYKRIGTASPLNVECTYDIYDKDPVTIDGFVQGAVPTADALEEAAAHRTREDVVASNTLRLGNLKDAGGTNVTKIQAGYYYDIYITIDPNYLYVLSDHDEPADVIIK